MRTILFCWLIVVGSLGMQAQSDTGTKALAYARAEVDTLCSPYFAGRGYLDAGHRKAAEYLAGRFQAMGLQPGVAGEYFQPFPLEINLVQAAKVSLDGQPLRAGTDFIVHRLSGAGEGSHRVVDLGYGLEKSQRIRGRVVLFRAGFPPEMANDSEARAEYEELSRVDQRIEALLPYEPTGFIVLQSKLTAGFARQTYPVPVIEAQADSLPARVRKVKWDIRSELTRVESQNVVGFIPGTAHVDSFVYLTAHYDHLGRYEEALFAGANDNASGTAMLLSLADYFADHPLPYTLVLVAFGGEETGLIGSRYMATQQPLTPLSNIRFLLNLDLMGNGTEGIMAVGGKDFPQPYDRLVALNDSLQAVPVVRARSNAPNSDHFFFLRQGVEGFFIYTMGGPPHYHDVNDTAENLELSKFLEVRELLIAFLAGMG